MKVSPLALFFSLALAGITSGSVFSAESQDFKRIKIAAANVIKPSFVSLPGLQTNRWQAGTIKWWYNPGGQTITTSEAVTAIEKATHTWESIAGIDFIYQGETTQALSNQNDDKLVIGWLDKNSFVSQFGDFSANAYVWWNGSNISDGEISINGGDPLMQDLDSFQGVITHELGHILGLDHSDDPRSIMFAAPYHTGEYQKYLRSDDILAAVSLYPEECIASHSANVDSALQISIPAIRWNDSLLSATLNYTGSGLIFSLAEYAYLQKKDQCHIDAVLTDDLSLHLPAVNIEGEKLLANIVYLGDSLFEVTDYQWLTQVGSEEASSDSKFGAIAWNTSGGWGYAYDYQSQTAANDAALGYCGSNCSIIAEAENACLALATGSGNSYGWGIDSGIANTEAKAFQECNSVSAASCSVAFSFCTSQ